MKKSILLIGVLFVGAVCCYAEGNDLDRHGLKGKVKSLKENCVMEYKRKGVAEKSENTIIYNFDEQGRIKEQVTEYLHEGGKMARYPTDSGVMEGMMPPMIIKNFITYTYDAKGRLVKEQAYERDLTTIPVKAIEYTYDENGKRIMELHYSPRDEYGEKEIIRMSYDNAGMLSERTKSTAGKTTGFEEDEKEQYGYDGQGRLVEKMYFDYETNRFWREWSAGYDAKGKMMEEKYYQPDGVIWKRTEYKYDEKGVCIASSSFDYNDNESKTSHQYGSIDKNGNYLEHVTTSTGKSILGEDPVSTVRREIEYY